MRHVNDSGRGVSREIQTVRRHGSGIRKWVAAGVAAASLFGEGFGPLTAENPQPGVERLTNSPVLRHLRPNPAASEASSLGAAGTLRQFYVPEGFRVDLVASEPEVRQPVAFAFDERGRIWVAEAYSYPTRRAEGQGQDQLVILSDENGDGRYETRKVFARGLNLVSGFEVGYGGVWVGAAPELLFIPDANRDDVPDGPPRVLLTGFGYQDTHECLNSFLWGPDGWLYGNQGVFNYSRIGKPGAADANRVELRAGVWRYHPVRHEFEVFAEGGSNQWGLDYDDRGQLFMTHCRSYWGRGGTTHVFQGGHYWNQANANYPAYILAEPPAELPETKNYLLASARYDHGAGGAGKPGSDLIYGGHSHVGTLIYQGDNWPAEYRGRLFTHNLHGHQINQQVNRRWGSGFDTVHAGRDVLFCSDPLYVAVDLQTGPDGAVYFIDWYDQQHCHNPNTERWDRGNGRIYRMVYAAGYQSASVNLSQKTDGELVALLGARNDWFARTARRLLHERAAVGAIESGALKAAETGAKNWTDPGKRLQALWTLFLAGVLDDGKLLAASLDPDEWIRAWAIQLSADGRAVSGRVWERWMELAQSDPSPVVRRYLASVAQRAPEAVAWALLERLAGHGEDGEDRNIPGLLWQSFAQRAPGNWERAFQLASATQIPSLADGLHWYAAGTGGEGLRRVLDGLAGVSGDALRRRLILLNHAIERGAVSGELATWKRVSAGWERASDARVRRWVDLIGASLGDRSRLAEFREILGDGSKGIADRRHALAVLIRSKDDGAMDVFLKVLAEPEFRMAALGQVARFDSAAAADRLMGQFEGWTGDERAAALNALTGRASLALRMLDAVKAGQFKREHLTSYHVRRLGQLGNAEVDRRVVAVWGRILQTPVEREAQIARLEKVFNEAPLWAYDGSAGRGHFQRLCASCHRLGEEGNRIGPELTGAGKNGIRYFLESIVDPDAVIGTDFQMTTLETRSGEVLSGIVVEETTKAVTLRTTTDTRVVEKGELLRRQLSEKSMMPAGLLESLKDREQIELLKYLTTH